MKRLIPTLLAVVILAAGFFYAKSQDFFREPPIEKLPLVEMQLNQVESIYLKLEDDELRMTRAGEEEWKLEDNPTYPLDSKRVEDWLVELLVATDNGMIDESPGSLSEFGLEPPVLELGIKLSDNTEQSIQVGNEMPVQGNHYLLKSDDPKLYRLENETKKALFRDRLYFTDKNVLSLDLTKIHAVEYTLGDQSWRLERQGDENSSFNAPWKINGYDRKYTDISSILGQTMYMSTDELPLSVSDMNMEGAHLQIVVEEYVDGELTEHVVVGEVKDDEKVLVWEVGKYWGYMITIDDLERLFLTGLEAIEEAAAEQENAEEKSD